MTCRSVLTGRTGHSVNTAPLCSQPLKVKLLERASRNDRNDFETLEFAVSVYWVVPQIPTVPQAAFLFVRL